MCCLQLKKQTKQLEQTLMVLYQTVGSNVLAGDEPIYIGSSDTLQLMIYKQFCREIPNGCKYETLVYQDRVIFAHSDISFMGMLSVLVLTSVHSNETVMLLRKLKSNCIFLGCS